MLKWFLYMNKPLSLKTFVLTQILILTLSLGFLYGLYVFLNQDRKASNTYSSSGGPITSTPKSLTLEVQQPGDNLLTFQSSVIVSGTTAPNSEVLISGDQDLVIKSKSDGSFSTVFNLNEGPNLITVVIFDPTGDQRYSTRSVFYSKEKI